MTLNMSIGTLFTILDESGVVTVYVPCLKGETSDEYNASFTHVLTDEEDFSSLPIFFST